jgi:hypothetical protein
VTDPMRRSFWLRPALGTIGTLVVVGGVASAIALGPWLQERGYPGFAIVVLVWLVAMVVVVRVARNVGPPRERKRELRAFAAAYGGTFVNRVKLPDSIHRLPSFSSPDGSVGVRNLVTFRTNDAPVMVFERWIQFGGAYEATRWALMAAREVPLDAGAMIVSPHGLLPVIGDGLVEVRTESSEFDRRFRIRTDERAFASAVMDQRMIAWFLDTHDDIVFETGGRWLSVATVDEAERAPVDALVDALGLFAVHVPRVTRALYPPVPPPRGSLSGPWS